MKSLSLFILLLLLLPLTMAATCDDLTTAPRLTQGYSVPGYMPYGDEVMNGYVADEYVGTITIVDRQIQETQCEPSEDPTYNIYVSTDEVFDALIASNATMDTVNDAMDAGDLRVEGTTTGKKVKMFFTSMVISVGSWFS